MGGSEYIGGEKVLIVGGEYKAADECCLVCGEESASRHYGSFCCSGCKGFFRRSVRFQKLYRCPYGQQCLISKMYRNCCRACRFQKCLKVGLDPNMVQSDWGRPSSRAKGGKRPKLDKTVVTKEEPREEERQDELLCISTMGVRAAADDRRQQKGISSMSYSSCPSASPLSSCSSNSSFPNSLVWHNSTLHAQSASKMSLAAMSHISPLDAKEQQQMDFRDALSLANYLVRVEQYCDYFVDSHVPTNNCLIALDEPDVNIPLEMAFIQPGLIIPRSAISWGNSDLEKGGVVFAKIFCRLVVHVLDWAGHLPELRCLPTEDRNLLLKRRTMPSMWWILARRSVPFNNGHQGLVVSGNMFYPRDPNLQAKLDISLQGLLGDAANLGYDALVLPMRENNITDAEAALLRAIAFFTPVARLSPEGHRQVMSAQNKYMNALSELIRQQTVVSGENPLARTGRLLMLLTALEQVIRLSDDSFAMFCMFNINGMRGTLNYDLHMNKC